MTNIPMPPDRSQTAPLVSSIIALSFGLLILVMGLVQLSFNLKSKTSDYTLEAILIPLGVVVMLGGIYGLRRVAMRRYIERHGIVTHAEILEAGFTKTEVDGQPVINLRLRVLPQDKAPYEVSMKWTMRPTDGMNLMVGKLVQVKVHPTKHREVIVA